MVKPGQLGGESVTLPYELTRAMAVARLRDWLADGQEWFRDMGLDQAEKERWRRRAAWLAGKARRELRGRSLACYCPLDGRPCHADVWMEIANQ